MKGPILVYAEFQNNKVKRATLEILSKFSLIAKETGNEIVCAITSAEMPQNIDVLKNHGATKVYTVINDSLKSSSAELHGRAIAKIAEKINAGRILFPQTAFSREIAVFCAGELKVSLVSNCIDVRLEGENAVYVKAVYSGKLLCDVKETGTGSIVAMIVPNAFQVNPVDCTDFETVNVEAEIGTVNKELVSADNSAGDTKDITEETILVGGGRALKGPEGFEMLKNLAGVFGGGVAASRAAVDSGWMPHSQQVGQTGKTVSPNLYVACGISGAIQHLVGMNSSKCIIAINKDPDAPVFATADYGIVGDVFEIVPLLTDELKKIKE